MGELSLITTAGVEGCFYSLYLSTKKLRKLMRQFSSRLYFILESERIFPLSFQDQRLNFQFVLYLVT